MTLQTIHLDDKPYVVLPRSEYDRLVTLAKAADLPELPAADADGNYPAVEYARAAMARGIIRDRVAVGLSQKELARRAGIAVESLCRIETAKVTPSLVTIQKIDRVLKQATERREKSAAKIQGKSKSRNK